MLHSVVIFVVAYWLVYFALREYIASLFTEIPLFRECRGALDSRRQLSSKAALFGRIFFVTASEIFWILSLSIGNYLLLSYEFSAARAAFISQWGVNLIIWLPLLPIWEEFAVYRVPTLWAERGNHLV
jgi:hypothetical protein